ncbi:hypothetical protein BB560_005038 [Smittium megazygosporum]|uniref:Exonuclease domain-containing protein n=1 Tax=Smittium megazygosporum TaxID=133381 RepID=A0A2T9Z7S0_9FUNG|nr:hypothetical protein BB560_005038 [Smittium megazygosporum]
MSQQEIVVNQKPSLPTQPTYKSVLLSNQPSHDNNTLKQPLSNHSPSKKQLYKPKKTFNSEAHLTPPSSHKKPFPKLSPSTKPKSNSPTPKRLSPKHFHSDSVVSDLQAQPSIIIPTYPNTTESAFQTDYSPTRYSQKNRLYLLPSSSSNSLDLECPVVESSSNQQIKWGLRQTFLERFFDEYMRIYQNASTNQKKLIPIKSVKKELSIYRQSKPNTYRMNALSALSDLKTRPPVGIHYNAQPPQHCPSFPAFIPYSPSPSLPYHNEAVPIFFSPQPSPKSRFFQTPSPLPLNNDEFIPCFDLDFQNPKVLEILSLCIMPETKLVVMDFPLPSILETPNDRNSPNPAQDPPFEEIIYSLNKKILLSKNSSLANHLNSNSPSKISNKSSISSLLGVEMLCERCGQLFVNQSPSLHPEILFHCYHHFGKLRFFNDKNIYQTSNSSPLSSKSENLNSSITTVSKKYDCCGSAAFGDPCNVGPHVFRIAHDGLLNQIHQFSKPFIAQPGSPFSLLALDCEMCSTTLGIELIRLTVIDHTGSVLIDELVKPEGEVLDLNTRFSGVHSLSGAIYTLSEIKDLLLKFVHSETILVGHALENDLRVLRIVHDKIIDTSYLFPHKKGLPYRNNLKDLAFRYLGKVIQSSEYGHSSLEDASTCLSLLEYKIKSMLNLKSA